MKIDFTATQKTVSRDNPTFQIGDRVYFKKQTTRQMGLEVGDPDTGLSILSGTDITSTLKTRLQERHNPATSQI